MDTPVALHGADRPAIGAITLRPDGSHATHAAEAPLWQSHARDHGMVVLVANHERYE